MRVHGPSGYSSWKQLFRPCAIGLIGLSISVFLWGFSYKLSLYHRHPTSHAPVVKLWVESRNSLVMASRLKPKLCLVHGLQALPVPNLGLPRLDNAVVYVLPEGRHGIASLAFLIPSRSPPSYSLSLA